MRQQATASFAQSFLRSALEGTDGVVSLLVLAMATPLHPPPVLGRPLRIVMDLVTIRAFSAHHVIAVVLAVVEAMLGAIARDGLQPVL